MIYIKETIIKYIKVLLKVNCLKSHFAEDVTFTCIFPERWKYNLIKIPGGHRLSLFSGNHPPTNHIGGFSSGHQLKLNFQVPSMWLPSWTSTSTKVEFSIIFVLPYTHTLDLKLQCQVYLQLNQLNPSLVSSTQASTVASTKTFSFTWAWSSSAPAC